MLENGIPFEEPEEVVEEEHVEEELFELYRVRSLIF
jgi:hypothetical protein